MNRHNQSQLEPAENPPIRRLILACGNTLRGDDGVGWKIAAHLERDPFHADDQIIVTQQFLPEHAELLSQSDVVVFVDCSAVKAPGQVSTLPIEPASELPRILTHHLDPASLLRMALDLYGKIPSRATAVTIGGSNFGLSEDVTPAVRAAIPAAIRAVQEALR